MNKRFKFLFTTLFFIFGITLTSCGPTSSEQPLEIVAFNVDESRVDTADVGSEYAIPLVSVEDSNGKFYQTQTSAKDPDNLAVTITANKFLCSKVGQYTVTYSVTLTDTKTYVKSFKVSVIDVSEPTIITTLKPHNITLLGSQFNVGTITLEDNSGEVITPTVTVSLNGTALVLSNNVVTFDQKGTYTIAVTAKDSSDNQIVEEYNVYTVMDNEHEKYYNNEWYPTEISDKFAKTGLHSYEFGMFANAPSWFNDYSLLGDVYLLDAAEANYVSFWIYFDGLGAGLESVSLIQNARYNAQHVYDIYGQEVLVNWQGKIAMVNNRWYRFVVNTTEYEMWGETKDIADADAHPIVETLRTFAMYMGAWDNIANNNVAKSMKVYLDDVRLLADIDDEVYEIKPEDPYVIPENVVADFESTSQIENFLPSWNTTVALNSEVTFGGSKASMVVTPYTQWSDVSFKNTSLTIDALDGFREITMKMYVQDTSADNVYNENTKLYIDGQYGTSPILTHHSVVEKDVWFDFTIPLGGYTDKKLSEGMKILFWKVANGKNYGYNQDIEYNGSLKIFIDDIKVIPGSGPVTYGPGTYRLQTTYHNIFSSQLDGLKYTNEGGNFSFYHGAVDSQKTFQMINTDPYQLGIGAGLNNEATDTFAEGWRFFFGANGAFGYRFDATVHCFVKVVEQTDGSGNPITGGWIAANMGYAILNETINVLSYGWVDTPGTLGTDFIELQAGESFCYQFSHSENRNIQNPPYLVIANAVAQS